MEATKAGTVERRRGAWPLLAMLAGIATWLWPIGLGGQMPAGGDVTFFSLGLMGTLRRSLLAGRLPVWNELWGYGFSSLAESQMGIFYPPNWVFYGLLGTETAFTLSMCLHAAWAALGAYWLARKLGVSPWGSALAGYVFATSGQSVIHMPHHWFFATASWMPWAWGLGLSLLRGEGGRRTWLLLTAVLGIQLLPGHFQIAFITQVGLLTIACASVLAARPEDRAAVAWRALVILGAVAAAAPLTAMQLWPTYRQSRLTAQQRDYLYLSFFTTSPLHLVHYVTPRLFRGTGLWRTIMWDPFRVTPEEQLTYVGLVPLFLALGAAFRGFRRDRTIWLLVAVLVVATLLSLGPYVPGFSLLIRLPGFSFFRAPARWGLGAALALAILAGKGFDTWRTWARPGRSLVRFIAIAVLAPAVVLMLFELAVASTEGPGIPPIAEAYRWVFDQAPWSEKISFREFTTSIRKPPTKPFVVIMLMHEGYGIEEIKRLRLIRERPRIYVRELAETGGVLLALLAIVPLVARRGRSADAALLILAAVDLWMLGRHRLVDLTPLRPVVQASPVLARLAAGPPGQRVIDTMSNFVMCVGDAPVTAYRTLDRPTLPQMTELAHGKPDDPLTIRALRATGTSVRVLDPVEPPESAADSVEIINDPTLASWLFGAKWVATREGAGYTRFCLWRPIADPPRAWSFPTSFEPELRPAIPIDGAPALDRIERGRPLPWRIPDPSHFELDVEANGPALVVASVLNDPEWEGRWSGPGGEQPAALSVAFPSVEGGGWIMARTPGPGPWTLRLTYCAQAMKTGLAVAGVSWVVWLLAFALPGRRRHPLAGGGEGS